MADYYLTENDVQNYGHDLLDVSQRAALHAVAPHLQHLEQQNAELQQRLAREQRHRLDQQIAAAVPNFREIDNDPRWHRWLLGVDPLNGRMRQHILDDAIRAGDPSRVTAFFRGYMQEQGAAGQTPGHTGHASQRARSAREKPIYTRELIGALYEQHRRGEFAGREKEWAQIEQDIFRAQREGRVQAHPYLTK
jgi:hypothetical protein